jgi:hypothetical protein
MTVHNAAERINGRFLSWKHTQAYPLRFGGTEFRIGKRENYKYLFRYST